jgi:Helicase conserved C-terminal domain
MPDLYHSLLGQDLGHLNIVAGQWGIELNASTSDAASKELVAALLNSESIAELIASLPNQAREALARLSAGKGRIAWAAFAREFGAVREMGAGRRDRERPHLKPSSTAEVLYYHALLARAFFDTENGPQEFAYIPDDLYLFMNAGAVEITPTGTKQISSNNELVGRGATLGERDFILPAEDAILDDATTLLAALRLGRKISPDPILTALLSAAGLLKKNVPQAEKVKRFLESSRPEALKLLITAWRASDTFNELRDMPGLVWEGEWTNRPRATREFLLGLLSAIPDGKWWNLNTFIRDIKTKYPDYQRPAGDYDSWFIRRAADGQYLRGFAYWDLVDGELVHFFITDILYRLGLVDLGSPEEGKAVATFRMVNPGRSKSKLEDAKVHISSQGRLKASRYVPRAIRYQLARFCEWEAEKEGEYGYRLTPQSLSRAKEQGLKVEHLLVLLAKHADAGIPPTLVKALKRWEANGTEARAETQIVLRVGRPEILDQLRKSKAARFLGEPLGPAAVVIKSGAQSKIMAALGELGLLGEDTTEIKEL